MGKYDLPKYDDWRKWIQRKREKGIAWPQIFLACKNDVQGLNKLTTYEGVRYLGNEENPYKVLLYVEDLTLKNISIAQGCEKINGDAFCRNKVLTSIEILSDLYFKFLNNSFCSLSFRIPAQASFTLAVVKN